MCEQKVDLLLSYRFLSIYTSHYLNKRLSMFEEIKLQRNNNLFEINQKPNYIYFIIEGELIMHKNIDFKQYLDNTQKQIQNKQKQIKLDQLKEKNVMNEQDEQDDQISKNKANSFHPFKKNTIISYLSPGSYIGLSELLTDSSYTYSVTCNSAYAKVYRLFKANFENFFSCDANIEIMAEDCLGKEKIYDDVLLTNVKMMQKQYTKFEQNNNNMNMLKIFENNQKRYNSCVNIRIPSSILDKQPEQLDRNSSIDQKIKKKLKRKNPKISQKEQENTKNIQNLIVNQINKDPYYRRKLLHNISSLGIKLNKDNCQIYNQLKSQKNITVNQSDIISNLEQEQIINNKMQSSNTQTQIINELEEIPEISDFNTKQQSQKLEFFNSVKQQEIKRQRLSFVINQQQLSKRSSLQMLTSQLSNDQPQFNIMSNSNKIEDLKYFENIANKQNNDNQCLSISQINKNTNLDQSIEFQIQANCSQMSTSQINDREQIITSNQVKQNSQELQFEEEKNSSIAPESTQESMTNSMAQIEQQFQFSPNKNQKQNSIKTQYLSRKIKTQDFLFSQQHSKTQMSPRKSSIKFDEEIDSIKEVPQIKSFLTQRPSLPNGLNKGNLQKDIEKNQKIQTQSISDFNQFQTYFSKQHQKSSTNIQASPQSEKSKMILYNSCLFQSNQEYPKTLKFLQSCQHSERKAQNNSQNTSISTVQSKTIQSLRNITLNSQIVKQNESEKQNLNQNQIINSNKDSTNLSQNKFTNTQRQIIKNKVYQLDQFINVSGQNQKQQTCSPCIGGTPKKIHKQNFNQTQITERKMTCPNFMNRQTIKKHTFTEFSNSNGDIQSKDFQETNIGFYTPQKSSNFLKQDSSINYKNSSFGQFSPQSTKISQITKPQIPSISLYSSYINSNCD